MWGVACVGVVRQCRDDGSVVMVAMVRVPLASKLFVMFVTSSECVRIGTCIRNRVHHLSITGRLLIYTGESTTYSQALLLH